MGCGNLLRAANRARRDCIALGIFMKGMVRNLLHGIPRRRNRWQTYPESNTPRLEFRKATLMVMQLLRTRQMRLGMHLV
jgi:hypothetical protein